MSDFQLIVIGAGPGGYTAALHAAKRGLKTACVEYREAGGTCLNRGCVPTKALLHASQVYKEAQNAAAIGVTVDGVGVDLPTMFAHKNEITGKLSAGIEGLFKSAKVTYLRGRGSIPKEGVVAVTAADGTVTEYTADNILIATGSVPSMPPIKGLDLPGVLTSDEILEGAEKLYDSIVIIGGGVIGGEFATFYSDLGVKVTVVEALDRMLPTLDKDLGTGLAMALKKQGVSVFTGAMVKEIAPAEGGLNVNFETAKGPGQAFGEVVLCAIGRKPYFDGLFTGEVKAAAGKGITVNEKFETSIPGVYAIGDVSSKIQLAHVAAAQGTACVDWICDKENHVDLNLVPSCIYCRPEIAGVGMNDAQAKEAGIEVKVGKCVMGANARTMIEDPGRSFMKIIARADDHKLIGASFMCSRATDMSSEIAQAIANGLTAEDLLAAMRPHPTFEEAMGEALEDLVEKLNK